MQQSLFVFKCNVCHLFHMDEQKPFLCVDVRKKSEIGRTERERKDTNRKKVSRYDESR